MVWVIVERGCEEKFRHVLLQEVLSWSVRTIRIQWGIKSEKNKYFPKVYNLEIYHAWCNYKKLWGKNLNVLTYTFIWGVLYALLQCITCMKIFKILPEGAQTWIFHGVERSCKGRSQIYSQYTFGWVHLYVLLECNEAICPLKVILQN